MTRLTANPTHYQKTIMCDSFFTNYVDAINGFTDQTTDLVPSMIFFSHNNCGSFFTPSYDGTFVTNPFSQGQTLSISGSPCFFIPWNFKEVVFTSNAGRTSTLFGPFLSVDTTSIFWQNNNGAGNDIDMFRDPIQSVRFVTILDWTSQALLPMCMGVTNFIGEYPLSRFFPQSGRCDAFMANTWCTKFLQNTECSCFAELPGIEAKANQYQVNLPVICFGQNCSLQKSYKTNNMLSTPCNISICQQRINQAPGIVNTSTDTIYCGGQFFNQSGQIPGQPSATPLPAPTNPTSSGTPFYTWIMLGVAGVLFIVLIFLLFAEKPKKDSNILKQIHEISKQQEQPDETVSKTDIFDY